MLILYGILFLLAGYFLPQEIDWNPSFSKVHTQPYGCKVLYDELGKLFPEGKVFNNELSFYEGGKELLDKGSNMIMIDEDLNMDSLELSFLFDYVEQGNTVLMSANRFPSLIKDTFGITVKSEFRINDVIREGFRGTEIPHNFLAQELEVDSGYVMMVDASFTYFQTRDSLNKCGALGWIEEPEYVNLVHKPLGKGHMILHSNPYIFGNFNMLSGRGGQYVAGVLSHLPQGDVIWDEYHKMINRGSNKSILHVVLSDPALKKAVYLSTMGILFILLFMSKRKQRIIKPVDVFSNDSKELVKTIGNMYYNTSDNKEILNKKIKLFRQEMVRSHGLKDISPRQEVVKRLSDRIGMEKEKLEADLTLIFNSQESQKISDNQLKKVNKVINDITHGT